MTINVKNHIENVLIVEDDQASQVLMREVFKLAGFSSTLYFAADGREVARFLAETSPQLILLDLNLPGKSGLEVLGEIRSHPSSIHIPVIILTGSNSLDDIKASAKFSCCRYLLKPSRFGELIELVRSLPVMIS